MLSAAIVCLVAGGPLVCCAASVAVLIPLTVVLVLPAIPALFVDDLDAEPSVAASWLLLIPEIDVGGGAALCVGAGVGFGKLGVDKEQLDTLLMLIVASGIKRGIGGSLAAG